jgi:hypothetical protein
MLRMLCVSCILWSLPEVGRVMTSVARYESETYNGGKVQSSTTTISQLYNRRRMLVFLRHVSTHFPSRHQALHNLRLITVKYLTKCVRDLIGLQYLSV